jgi:hypothetical protein
MAIYGQNEGMNPGHLAVLHSVALLLLILMQPCCVIAFLSTCSQIICLITHLRILHQAVVLQSVTVPF